MQQTGELTTSRFENPFDGPGCDGFISALSIAILSKSGDLETVWDITNRVYDRWNGAAEWAENRASDNLAMGA
ncbi:MAG TPA: hypothetical protein VLW84_11895 [Terriglobales bacterium]|nr:hypothetical protein [Terriglobales bacterium]